MPTSTNVTNLKINELTEAQYDAAVLAGTIGPNEISIITDAEAGQVIQIDTMPTAAVEEVDKIYQFIGTTDANYTNGYFYKCVSDGGTPTPAYSWTQIDVQPTPSVLPDQTGNSGKFLTTDGTDASWSDKPLVNKSTGFRGLAIGSSSTRKDSILIGLDGAEAGTLEHVTIGNAAKGGSQGVTIGESARGGATSVAIGRYAEATGTGSIAIRGSATSQEAIALSGTASAIRAIQIGSGTNSDANTVKISNANGNFEIMSADGTIPADRLIHAINKYSTMPTAASTNEGWIVQFTGTTDSTYTHGHLYECVSDGGNPATYSWAEVQLGGGGSSYTAGTGIDITSGVISVTSPTLQNTATGTGAITIGGTAATLPYSINIGDGSVANISGNGGGVAVGRNTSVKGDYAVAVGSSAKADSYVGIAIGASATAGNAGVSIGQNTKSGIHSISIGSGANTENKSYSIAIGETAKVTANNAVLITVDNQQLRTNSDAETFKFANHNGLYEIISADGTIPEARLADTTNATQGQVLTLDANNNAVWQTPSTAVTTASATLAVADWSSNTQTITVNGVTSSNVVIVSPQPLSATDYAAAGILCTGQAANSLTFTCTATPSTAISLSIVIIG